MTGRQWTCYSWGVQKAESRRLFNVPSERSKPKVESAAGPGGSKLQHPPPLLTRAEVAAHFRCSERTLRRILAKLLVEHPEIRPIRAGGSLLFSERMLRQIEEALMLPPPYVARPAPRVVRVVSGRTGSGSGNSALDALLALVPPKSRPRGARKKG